jgi:outer membrane protein assembly factor BamB
MHANRVAAPHRLTTLRWLLITLGSLQACWATDKLTYHVDRARSGWNARETVLTPANVASPRFALQWSTPPLDSFAATPARLFATPLYVASVNVTVDGRKRQRLSVIYAASATGFVYAINARTRGGVPAGAQLWRRRLTDQPCRRGSLGILSTPVIDLRMQRLYVSFCDERDLWQAVALDLRDGRMIAGWPVRLDAGTINAPGINRNGANRFPESFAHVQRSALNLSPDGARLYVSFGGEPTSGWLLALDTLQPRVASAFSATRKTEEGVGGMWAAGGPAVDNRGHIYLSTGSSVLNTLADLGVAGVFPDSPGNWGQSVIELTDSRSTGLTLAGTYTPFNYCQAGSRDMDLGASSPILVDLAANSSSTPHLLALGGAKQGNAYLLDREQLPGSLTQRQPCSDDAASDRSLLAPEPQPQFGRRGPLNIFGPYTERDGMGDQARSRSTLAHFRNAAGIDYLFATGSAKTGAAQSVSAAPGLVRLRIMSRPEQPSYLRLDRAHDSLVLQNPGSPIVSSHGTRNAIVWILDSNKPRSASLYGLQAPQPVLYAVDAESMRLLWRSNPGELLPSGKYNEATVADGLVIVGTDRIQVFGLGSAGRPRLSPTRATMSPGSASTATPVVPAAGAADLADGGRLYAERCRACHESSQSGIPPVEKLYGQKADAIVEKLLLGSMQTQALGLTEQQIGQIALYLAGPH